jgi:hypothetical protein
MGLCWTPGADTALKCGQLHFGRAAASSVVHLCWQTKRQMSRRTRQLCSSWSHANLLVNMLQAVGTWRLCLWSPSSCVTAILRVVTAILRYMWRLPDVTQGELVQLQAPMSLIYYIVSVASLSCLLMPSCLTYCDNGGVGYLIWCTATLHLGYLGRRGNQH